MWNHFASICNKGSHYQSIAIRPSRENVQQMDEMEHEDDCFIGNVETKAKTKNDSDLD